MKLRIIESNETDNLGVFYSDVATGFGDEWEEIEDAINEDTFDGDYVTPVVQWHIDYFGEDVIDYMNIDVRKGLPTEVAIVANKYDFIDRLNDVWDDNYTVDSDDSMAHSYDPKDINNVLNSKFTIKIDSNWRNAAKKLNQLCKKDKKDINDSVIYKVIKDGDEVKIFTDENEENEAIDFAKNLARNSNESIYIIKIVDKLGRKGSSSYLIWTNR